MEESKIERLVVQTSGGHLDLEKVCDEGKRDGKEKARLCLFVLKRGK